jgi:hypothetical protein
MPFVIVLTLLPVLSSGPYYNKPKRNIKRKEDLKPRQKTELGKKTFCLEVPKVSQLPQLPQQTEGLTASPASPASA